MPNINTYYCRDVFGEMLLKMLIKQNFINVREMFLFSSKLIETISLLAGFWEGNIFRVNMFRKYFQITQVLFFFDFKLLTKSYKSKNRHLVKN